LEAEDVTSDERLLEKLTAETLKAEEEVKTLRS